MIDKYVFARCQKVFGICLRAFVFSVHKPCLDGGNKRSVSGQGLGPLVQEEEEVCRLGGKAVAVGRAKPPSAATLFRSPSRRAMHVVRPSESVCRKSRNGRGGAYIAERGELARVLTTCAVADGVSDFVCCAELHQIANFLRQRTNFFVGRRSLGEETGEESAMLSSKC